MKTYLTLAELTLTPRAGRTPSLHYYIKDEYSVTQNINEAYIDIHNRTPSYRLMERSLPVSILEDIMNNDIQRDYLVSNLAFKLKDRQGRFSFDFWYRDEYESGYTIFSVKDVPEHLRNIKEDDLDKIEEYIRFQINQFIAIESIEKRVSKESILYAYKIEEDRVLHEIIVEPSEKKDSHLFNERVVVGEGEDAVELAVTNSLFLFGIDSNFSTDVLLERTDSNIMPILLPNRYASNSFFFLDHRLHVQRFRIVDVVRTDNLSSVLSKIEQHDNGRDYFEYRIVSKNGVSIIITNNLNLIKELPESIKKYNGELPRVYYKIIEINKVDTDTLSDKIFTEMRIYNTREDDKNGKN